MVSASVQRQEIYVWTLNNRTGANIDYRTVSVFVVAQSTYFIKLSKKIIFRK